MGDYAVTNKLRHLVTREEVIVHLSLDPSNGREIWVDAEGRVYGALMDKDPHPGYEVVDPMEGFDYDELAERIYAAEETLRAIADGPGAVTQGRLEEGAEEELLFALGLLACTTAQASHYILGGRAARREREAKAASAA